MINASPKLESASEYNIPLRNLTGTPALNMREKKGRAEKQAQVACVAKQFCDQSRAPPNVRDAGVEHARKKGSPPALLMGGGRRRECRHRAQGAGRFLCVGSVWRCNNGESGNGHA